MRVLYVTNRFPGRSTRGDQLRAYHHVRALAARHAITLLSFGQPEDAAAAAELRACCAETIVAPRSLASILAHGLWGWMRGEALQVAAYRGMPGAAQWSRLCTPDRFDLAHLQLIRLAPLLDALAPLPCTLDLVDALSLNMARRGARDRGPAGWIARLEAPRLAALEQAVCRSATGVAICSAADRAAIGVESIALVPNGVDLAAFPYVAEQQARRDIVFVGNLGYYPNIDAVQWFVSEVLPRVDQPARLQLVGARPARAIRALAAPSPRVDLIGPVPDVHPYLRAAAVAVVPMRAGSGQQLKLIEAMASGTAVVTSSLSAAGLALRDGVHALIADDPAAMAAAVDRLLADADLRAALAQQARLLVEQAHSWEASAAALERLWLSRLAPT